MSGPKVVRVIIREERVADAMKHLARLDMIIARWGAEIGNETPEAREQIAKTKAQRLKLESLIETDRFQELAQGVKTEISFLEQDIRQHREISIQNRAAHLYYQQRTLQTAAMLLKALDSLPAEDREAGQALKASLEAIKQGGSSLGPEAEAILAQAMSLISRASSRPDPCSEPQADLTPEQHQLARRLGSHLETEEPSLEAWKNEQQARLYSENPRFRVIWQHIAELEVFGPPQAHSRFFARLETIAAMEEKIQNLHLDSLVLELADTARQARQDKENLEALELLYQEFKQWVNEWQSTDERTGQVRQLLQDIETTLEHRQVDALAALLAEAQTILAQIQGEQVAAGRRQALLEGLASLGYGVSEGMGLAWAQTGRMVVQNPRLPGYGIEVGGSQDSARLQIRPVAFIEQSEQGEQRDAQRERDVETLWCQDFEQLQTYLAQSGHDLNIERKTAVGVIPLKYVVQEEEGRSRKQQALKTLKS